jgi:hypothetical protein
MNNDRYQLISSCVSDHLRQWSYKPIWIIPIVLKCIYIHVRCQLLEKMINCIEFMRFKTRYRVVPNRFIWYQCIVQFTVWIVDRTPWKVSLGEATPEESANRKMTVSIAGNAASTNLGASIDRRVRESQWREYWRTRMNLKGIGRL